MTLSFWRYAHLALALFSSIFLFLATVTGIILAVDAVQEKTLPYKTENFNEITLGETLPILKKAYPEITELSVDYNQFVTLQAIDQDGNDVNAYVDPKTGKALGTPVKKSEFIQWVTSFHRSLFLHEAGRFFCRHNFFLFITNFAFGFCIGIKETTRYSKFLLQSNQGIFRPVLSCCFGAIGFNSNSNYCINRNLFIVGTI
ncbi:hypothetical protein AAGS39_16920 [Flavobacterium sp. CGRL2]